MTSNSLFCPHCGAAYSLGEKQCAFCRQVFADEAILSDQDTLLHQRYELLNQIGTGGFGAVYRARDTRMQQGQVAIKQINLQGLTSQEIIEATDGFNRERQFLSSLTHSHLPRIYDYFMDTEHWYLIMEFIEGQTLEVYLQPNGTATHQMRTLSVDEVVDIGLQLCDVLGYLHRQPQPIIFRDLKPSNVMRTRLGALYLIDFGIARYFKPGKPKDTIPFGSPGYAAPEQYGKAQTTGQADIYSLGALLYYLLSGLDPAENPFHFAPLRLYGVAGLAALEALIMQMVSLDAQDRPSDIETVATNLQRISHLRESSEQRIWRPPPAQNPPSASQAASSTPYYWPSSAGQQQAQMYQSQAQSQKAKAQGIGRRKLIKRGWQIGLTVGVGAVILHNIFPEVPQFHSARITHTDMPQPYMVSILDTVLPNGAATITSIQPSQIKQLIAVADQAGNIFILSTTTHEVVYHWRVSQPVTSLSWTLDEKYLSIAAGTSIYTWVIPPVEDVTREGSISNKPWAVFHNIMPATVRAISWSPADPLILAVSDIDDNVRVFQISPKWESGHAIYELTGMLKPSQFIQGPPPPVVTIRWFGSQLYSLVNRDSVNVWDWHNPAFKAVTNALIGLTEDIKDILVISYMNFQFAVLTASGHINLLSANYQVVMSLRGVGWIVNAITVSSDGQYIFGATGGGIYVWSVRFPDNLPVFVSSQNVTPSIDYVENRDGKLLIAGGMHGVMQIWQAV